MKAKDTVVPVKDHSQGISCPHCGEVFGIESEVEYERQFQAEITWGIAFKAGIKEVVETYKRENPSSYAKYKNWWQNKPEEWGL